MAAVVSVATMATPAAAQQATYHVVRAANTPSVDGVWDKPEWAGVSEVELTHYMGDVPPFRPVVHAKMQYDDTDLYLIFRVHDRYVSSLVETNNGFVSSDACVEFFFAPDVQQPLNYINMEINAGGTPLIRYNGAERKRFTDEDIAAFDIAHSLPKVVDPPINDSVTWTIECRIPLAVIGKYGVVTPPGRGVAWRANFYKTASKSTNPHYITWSPMEYERPNFHLPAQFGRLVFN